jgi:cytochrome P450
MVLNPEVQRKAQEEIDAVVSANQFPTFADRPKLQYVERILQETFRWNLAVPLSTRTIQLPIF